MGTAAYGNFWQRQQAADNAHDTELNDDFRKQRSTQYDVVSKNIQGILANGVDPHTQQPLSDEQKNGLQGALNTVLTYQKNLANPRFDVQKGEVPEDPLHRLTTKIGITKDTHPAPQQMDDLNNILAQYGGETVPNPFLKQKRLMTESGAFTPEQINQSLRVSGNVEAKPQFVKGKWKPVSGTLPDGTRVVLSHDEATNSWTDANGDEVDPEQMKGFKMDPKGSGFPRKAWGKDEKGIYSVSLDRVSNQELPGSRNYNDLPPASIVGSIRTGHHWYLDAEGNPIDVPVTMTTTPNRGGARPTSGKPMSEEVPGTNMTSTGPKVTVPGALPKAKDQTTTMLEKDAIKASDSMRTMSAILKTQTDYMGQIQRGETPTPRQDLALVIAAVRSMNPGTVRLPNKELELEIKAGSWGDRFARQYETAVSGTLPNDQRADLYNVVRNETTNSARSAADNWNQVFKGKQQLPPHLKGFETKQKTVKIGGQEYQLDASNQVTVNGHTYALQPDNKTLKLVK